MRAAKRDNQPGSLPLLFMLLISIVLQADASSRSASPPPPVTSPSLNPKTIPPAHRVFELLPIRPYARTLKPGA